jgi:hypothetical protein
VGDEDLTTKLGNVVKGPTFAGAMDVADAVQKDPAARRELEALIDYLANQASSDDALATILASGSDTMQLFEDDKNMVPMYHVMAEAAAGSLKDASGRVVQTSMVDAQTSLLSRISGRAYDKNHVEVCSREIDPNQVLSVAMKNLVTPLQNADGTPRKSPIEVIMDVIADVNRVHPDRTDRLDTADYANVCNEVSDFLLNKERGLEQFYAIVRNGVE